MEITDFLAIGVVGAIATGAIQLLKKRFGTDGIMTKFLTVAVALVLGSVYVWLRSSPYFETVLIVLGSSSTVYALLVK